VPFRTQLLWGSRLHNCPWNCDVTTNSANSSRCHVYCQVYSLLSHSQCLLGLEPLHHETDDSFPGVVFPRETSFVCNDFPTMRQLGAAEWQSGRGTAPTDTRTAPADYLDSRRSRHVGFVVDRFPLPVLIPLTAPHSSSSRRQNY
jgi:hypothetical protein